MKKSMISKLVVLVVVMIVAGGFAFGAQQSLSLEGTVTSELDFTLTPDANASSLVLYSATQNQITDLKVGTSVIVTNNYGGYTVTATSTNDGVLTAGNGRDVSYSAKIGSFALFAEGTDDVYTVAAGQLVETTDTKDVTVSYLQDAYASGTYTDTITFTVTAN